MGEVTPLELFQRWLASPGVSPKVLCAQYPELLPEVQACIDRAAAAATPPASEDTITQQAAPDISSDASATDGSAPPADLAGRAPASAGGAPQGYVMGDLAGKGGLGEVYAAFDETLGRTVALKRIRRDIAHTPPVLQRFVAESRVTARLEHPGVIPVHAAGQENGPFYTMKFIQGTTLRNAVNAHYAQSRVVSRELLRRFISVCQAVEFAHSRKVIHRDIKPDNIMLGAYGETILLDWGVAISPDSPAHEGERVGTPGYMPPEQARGTAAQQGPASDIHALGGVLCAILNNASPGRARSPELAPAPPALAAIMAKAMEANSSQRYPTAAALAKDVQAWLDDEPVSVYRDPWSVRLFRWMRRHRTPVTATAAAALLGIVAILASNVLIRREQRRTSLELATSNIAEADALASAGAPVESLRRIQTANDIFDRLHEPDDAAVVAALNVVWRSGSPSLSSADPGPKFRDAAIRPGHPEALVFGDDGTLRFINLQDGTSRTSDTGDLMSALAVSPKGDLAAIGLSDGTVKLIGYDSGAEVWTAAQAHPRAVRAARFSPAGKLASLGGDGSVRLWKTTDAAASIPVALPEGTHATAIAFPDDQHLAVAYGKGFYLYAIPEARVVASQLQDDAPNAIAGSPDGLLVATGDAKGVLRVWRNGVLASAWGLHCGALTRLFLSPDDSRAWFAAASGRCGRVELDTGEISQTLAPDSGAPVRAMDVDWNGGMAITAAQTTSGWTLESWNLRGNPLEKRLTNTAQVGNSVAFSRGGGILMTLHSDGRLGSWDLATGFELLPAGSVPAGKLALDFGRLSDDASAALPPTESYSTTSASQTRPAPVYATAAGAVHATISELGGSTFRILSPDGTMAATLIAAQPKPTLAIWILNIASPTPVKTFELDGPPAAGAFSADGRQLAVGLESGQALLFNTAGGTRREFAGTNPIRCLCFVGNQIALGSSDGMLRLWSPDDPATQKSVQTHQIDFINVVCPASGHLLFTSGHDSKVRVWSRDLAPVHSIDLPAGTDLVAVSPTGDCLILHDDAGLLALHLDFARRMVDANVGHAADSPDQLALRYLALGRPDWFLDTVRAGNVPWVTDADRAGALWETGRIADAKAAYGRSASADPSRAADFQACINKLNALAP